MWNKHKIGVKHSFQFFSLLKSRKLLSPVLTTLVNNHTDQITSRRESTRINSAQSANDIANAFAHKTLVIKKARNDHAEEVFERSKKLLQTCDIPIIDCRYAFRAMCMHSDIKYIKLIIHLKEKLNKLKQRSPVRFNV